MSTFVKLVGTSTYLPGKKIKFDDINDYLGNLDNASTKIQKWIDKTQPTMKEMIGVDYCHYAFDSETRTFHDDCLSMSVKASEMALENAKLSPQDIDLIIYASAYSHNMPPISTLIQDRLGIKRCGELQIHANCTSVYKAIKMAQLLLASNEYKNALVVSSSIASSYFIPEFYNHEVVKKEDIFLRWYLCDGAGAFVLSATDNKKNGLFLENTYFESVGGGKESGMGNTYPYTCLNPLEIYKNGYHHIRQSYMSELSKNSVEENQKTIFFNYLIKMIKNNEIDISQLKHFVINMPSKAVRETIMYECVNNLNIPIDKFYSSIDHVGYAGPPAGLISIDNLLKEKAEDLKDGELIFSFVMEVSKYMVGGFTLRFFE